MTSANVSTGEVRQIAKEAYIYGFAMLENYQTMRKQAVDASAREYVGGFNVFRHYSEPFTPANHDVVTPNNDTPYSWAWLDLRAGPVVLSVPADVDKRYYVIQCVDLFTHNFAYVGVRATGFDAGHYLFAGPGRDPATAAGMTRAFRAETQLVGMLMRVMLDGPEDVPNVRTFQQQVRLAPLGRFLGQPAPPAAPAIDFPTYDPATAHTHDFIGYLNFLLQFCQPPHPSEVELMQRFARIGIGPGLAWKAASADRTRLAEIDVGIEEAKAAIRQSLDGTFSASGLFGTREGLKNDYLKRTVGAAKGLYGNSDEEAWYGGYEADGAKRYTVTFGRGALPPAKFFWSITMYSLPDRFLVENPLRRYSIGDRTKGLRYGKDGSLTIFVQHESPGKDNESNWLPAPAGPFSLVVRVYGPEKPLLDGAWTLPPLGPVR